LADVLVIVAAGQTIGTARSTAASASSRPASCTGQLRCPHEGSPARVRGRGCGGADGARLAGWLHSRAVRGPVHVTRTRPRWPWVLGAGGSASVGDWHSAPQHAPLESGSRPGRWRRYRRALASVCLCAG